MPRRQTMYWVLHLKWRLASVCEKLKHAVKTHFENKCRNIKMCNEKVKFIMKLTVRSK